MTTEAIVQLFERTGALLRGHFLLSSGLHSDRYFQCARVLQYPQHAETLAAELARRVGRARVDVVVSPAIGGIVAGHEIGRALGVRAIFTEREDGIMTLRRGFELRPGERVLAVEDVVTTGGSLREVLQLVDQAGARPVGVACLVDRSGGPASFTVPFHPLIALAVQTYEARACPLCEQGVTLTKPGSRHLGRNP